MLQGVTLSDQQGANRIRKLQDRAKHIDDQIAELQDKREIIQHEIEQERKKLQPAQSRKYCDPCDKTHPECDECGGPPKE